MIRKKTTKKKTLGESYGKKHDGSSKRRQATKKGERETKGKNHGMKMGGGKKKKKGGRLI